MGWQFLAVIQVFVSSSDALLQRSIAKTKGASSHTKATLSHVGVVLVGLIWVLSAGGVSLQFNSIAYVYVIASALLIALGVISLFKAAETVDAANLNIIIMLRAVGVMVVAAIFLDETLSIYQLLGAVLIMLAGYIASHPDKGEEGLRNKGVLFALIGVIFFSVGLVLEKASMDIMGYETYILIGWGLQLTFLLLFSTKYIARDGRKKIVPLIPKLAVFGFFSGTGRLNISSRDTHIC